MSLSLMATPSAQAAVTKPLTDQELTLQECGACHFPYPGKYLPAYSWKKIIDNLSNHFGGDASLDKESRRRILKYMAAGRSLEIPIRITKSAWWKRIHGRAVKAMAAKGHIVVSNCGKCHR